MYVCSSTFVFIYAILQNRRLKPVNKPNHLLGYLDNFQCAKIHTGGNQCVLFQHNLLNQ